MTDQERAARRRRREIAPQVVAYEALEDVLWPFVTVNARPDSSGPVVSTDSRGHRITRLGTETARSDQAPDDAAFVLGGSVAFGTGATDDSGTLAAALWRRTGIPYVNLGVRAGSSTQELVTALPFADRITTFVVFSGLNNLTRARGAEGLDALYGYVFGDSILRKLASVPFQELARRLENPLSSTDDLEVVAEARRRIVKRVGNRFGRRWARRRKTVAAKRPKVRREIEEIVELASSQHLRDLRILRRMVPDGATVVFCLQPYAPMLDRTPSPEEEQIFAALDLIQGEKWLAVRDHIRACWGDYAGAIEQGCEALGVPFLDTSEAHLDGWCFVDRAHMTDRGYDAAAEMLEEVVPHADREVDP
jgi:hypothetical protein